MKNKNILTSVLLIYVICFILRLIEYFILRTDYTVIGEALFHKLAGILILVIFARIYKYRADEVGFSLYKCELKLAVGLLFGLVCFTIAYFVEVLITKASGSYSGLKLYVSSYSVNGNLGNQTGFLFFALCMNCLILILSSAVVGYKYGLITKITGSGFMAMGDHFGNNTLVNILHVVSENGADQLQIIRISIAQTLSFILVLVWYFYSKNHKKVLQVNESIE